MVPQGIVAQPSARWLLTVVLVGLLLGGIAILVATAVLHPALLTSLAPAAYAHHAPAYAALGGPHGPNCGGTGGPCP
jgi:hypothetical protein